DTTGFEPNVFTTSIPGVNDAVQLSVTGANCGLPTVGTVHVVLVPKPGLPTDPNDPNAFIDVFTDIDPLFVINNESGWYEGWMIHDLTVPNIAPARSDGTGAATFGTITTADAAALKAMGTGNNVPGNIFTTDGSAVHFPNASDHFPDVQTNVVPLQESMGAYNAMQQSDVHTYWEFNYLGTNWIHPLYELPFTGGFPGDRQLHGIIHARDARCEHVRFEPGRIEQVVLEELARLIGLGEGLHGQHAMGSPGQLNEPLFQGCRQLADIIPVNHGLHVGGRAGVGVAGRRWLVPVGPPRRRLILGVRGKGRETHRQQGNPTEDGCCVLRHHFIRW